MRRLTSAVGIVSARGADGPVGMSATSITSLTADPPTLLLCINRKAGLHACLAPGAHLCVSLLSRHQREVSIAFGGALPREARFGVGGWSPDGNGLPSLHEAQANLSCTIDRLMPYGTHSVVIARVDLVKVSDDVAPLLYQDGDYL